MKSSKADSKTTTQLVHVNGMKVWTGEVEIKELSKKEWERCIVPEQLGVPLKVKRFRHRRADERIDRDVGIFMMVQPETGLADFKWQQECGLLGFARTDGVDFTPKLFWELYDFIYSLMDYYGEPNGAILAIRKMNPGCFQVYTNQSLQYSEVFRAYNPHLFDNNNNINETADNHDEDEALDDRKKCDYCGEEEPRYRCGTCKEVNYCQKECQKNDWPNHKLLCQKK